MFYINFIYLFILFFIENINARRPLDYCNNINPLPAYLLHADQNQMGQFDMNHECNITLDELPSVSQDEIFDIVDQSASTSALEKGKGSYID